MPAESPLRLEVSGRMEFGRPVGALYALGVLAALASAHPVAFAAAAVSVFAVAWLIPILDFSKSHNHVKLTSVIFPDGRVHLESGEAPSIAGVMAGPQWCTRHLAVLRVNAGGGNRNLLILSRRQEHADDYRRLSVWLRQGLCNSASAGPR